MKTSQSGSLPSWLKGLPWGHELFNSLEMGASQPGQQRGGSCPSKGKLLPVMTFSSAYFPFCSSNLVKPKAWLHVSLDAAKLIWGRRVGGRQKEHRRVWGLLVDIYSDRQGAEKLRSPGALPLQGCALRLPPSWILPKCAAQQSLWKRESHQLFSTVPIQEHSLVLGASTSFPGTGSSKADSLNLCLLQILNGVSSWAVTSREVCYMCLVDCVLYHTLKFTS